MASRTGKRNQKRCLHEIGQEPQQKRQKRTRTAKVEPVAAAQATTREQPQAKTLTNIYYDCLDRIFDFLDIESLLNVARTCKRLQIAAAAKFGDDSATDTVVELYLTSQRMHGVRFEGGRLRVIGFRSCLPFLRCFGAKIKRVIVEYRSSTTTKEQIGHFDRYLNQYCASSLTLISFWRIQASSIRSFQKPFESTTAVQLYGSSLGNQLARLANLFPAMERLSILDVEISKNANAAVYFPNLTQLKLWANNASSGNVFTNSKMVNLLRANHHIQSLDISPSTSMKLNKLSEIISEMPFIWGLRIGGKITDLNWNKFAKRWTEMEPRVLELLLEEFLLAADEATALVQQLGSKIKKIRMRVRLIDRLECDRFVNQLDGKWQHCIQPRNNHFVITINL